ncbi:MAG: phosphoglycerate dehydrogenase [Ruminococcaceae bacterium]|nr:phosphoglycerate dehydrogenase [Oscillospiraceae bacterium]
MVKVLVTPRSFGKTDPKAYDILADAGIEIVRNETGSILNEDKLAELLADCDGVIIGVDPLTARVLNAAPHLKAIAKYGVGLDNIDLEICKARGIQVSRTIGANSEAVADYAFALMLALARRLLPIDRLCRLNDWQKITTVDVSGRTLGLFGFGAIGRNVAQRASGFNMEIMAYDVVWDEDYAAANNIIRATADEICAKADFISLHLPLLPETNHFIDARRLEMMKPTAILINTARGGLIDEKALLQALKEEKIYGAGIDVFETEPPADKSWYELSNVILGSHCAASTIGATENMGRMAAANLIRDLSSAGVL